MDTLRIGIGDLTHDAVHWWELAGHDPEDLAGAWAQSHHAARLAALVGTFWGSPRGDSAHTALTWMSGHGLLDGLFVSEPVAGPRPMRGVLRLWNLDLLLVEETGVPIETTQLVGMTLAEAHDWIVQATTTHASSPKRAIHPIKTDPVSPVSAEGKPFAEASHLAQAELIRLYANSTAVLEQFTWTVEGASPVRVWPHSFEASVQVRLPALSPEESPRFIVLGLAPPGELSASGYWYVAPWRVGGDEQSPWAALPFGSWVPRTGEPPIAILPLTEVTSTQNPAEQHARLAGFLASAFNESVQQLRRQDPAR